MTQAIRLPTQVGSVILIASVAMAVASCDDSDARRASNATDAQADTSIPTEAGVPDSSTRNPGPADSSLDASNDSTVVDDAAGSPDTAPEVSTAAPDATTDVSTEAADAAPEVGVDASPGLIPSLFAIDDSGAEPAGYLDLSALTPGQSPDVVLWDLAGSEASAISRFGGDLVIGTDDQSEPVLIWRNAQTLTAGDLPNVRITNTTIGGFVTPNGIFTTPGGDIWLTADPIYRVAEGATLGNSATGSFVFSPGDVPFASILDTDSNTLFVAPDLSSIVAFENTLAASDAGNTVSWSFAPTARAEAFVIASGRLFAGLRGGAGGGPTLQIWNNIASLTGPGAATEDETFSSATAFAGYRNLAVTDDDFLIGVYVASGVTTIHVFSSASTLNSSAVPTVITEPDGGAVSFGSLDSLQVSKDGTLFATNGSEIVVIPDVTSPTPGSAFTLNYSATALVVID